MKKLFSVLSSAKWLLVGSQLFSFLTIFFSVCLLATSAWLISRAAEHPQLAALSLAIVGVRFYGISRAVARYVERYLSHNMAFQGLYALRTWLYSVIEPLAPAVIKKYSSGDILGRIMADIEILQFFYLRVLIPPVTAIAVTLIFGAYLGQFSWALTALLVGAFIVSGIIMPLVALFVKEKGARGLLPQRAYVKEILVESMAGMMDIVAYNSRESLLNKLEGEWEKESTYTGIIGRGNNLGTTFLNGGVQITVLLGIVIMSSLVLEGKFSGVYLAVVAIGIQAYFEALQPMNDVFYHWGESKRAMDRLVHLDQEKPLVEDPQEPISMEAIESGKVPSIEFDHMSFAYEGKVVHEDFTLTIEGGEHIAIIGPSGSGKTSLFNVLERFYDYGGSIRIGGVELRQMTQAQSRSLMSMVDQSPYIFHATLEDNIRLAEPYSLKEDLEEAIAHAKLETLVEQIGLETMVGGGGSQLSGGERQRVALGRLYLSNHPIWLLDEPLEGLDQITRKSVYENLEREMAGKTVLLITHQLQGLEKMDRILFLEKGHIKEIGTYRELMEKKGDFYKYVTLSMAKIQ